MARTTKTPHKVSRNKSGTPIVRASKLFPGRRKRTTRETVFDTEKQADTPIHINYHVKNNE